MSDKHAPDSLKYQWRLLGVVLKSDWATSLDKSVAFAIIDNYFAKHGNSRASISYLQVATGSGRRHVIDSCRRLAEKGIVSVTRQGIGTRPTEYKIHFELVAENSSGSPTDTTSGNSPSGSLEVTSGGSPEDTTRSPSSSPEDTQTVLRSPADKPADRLGGIDTLTTTPAEGLAATAAEVRDPRRVEPFERFWAAYPRKYQRPKAEAAWRKLSPDTGTVEEIVHGALELAQHYSEHPIEKRWMATPANWLSGKRWTEDLPEPYGLSKKSHKADDAPSASPEAIEEPWDENIKPDVSLFSPLGRSVVMVSDATTAVDDAGDRVLRLKLQQQDGKNINVEFKHEIVYESDNPSRQEAGQKHIQQLSEALGKFDDAGELIGRELTANVDRYFRISYGPAD